MLAVVMSCTDMLAFFFAARTSEIVQIAAIYGTQQFSKYIMPIKPITEGASKATGLVVRNNELFHNESEMATCTLHEA